MSAGLASPADDRASENCTLFNRNHRTTAPITAILQVVDRVRAKAATYGQDFSPPAQQSQPCNGDANGSGGGRRLKVAPETIAMLYDKWVMPMTKQVQVRWQLSLLLFVRWNCLLTAECKFLPLPREGWMATCVCADMNQM